MTATDFRICLICASLFIIFEVHVVIKCIHYLIEAISDSNLLALIKLNGIPVLLYNLLPRTFDNEGTE